MNKRILQLAVPSIISNITVPLLGLVDVAIVGHIGDAAYIGAIAVGSMLFNVIYWLFGFLRMGTSGMTSQALGRRDLAEVLRLLVRSLSIGVGIGVLFFVLQKWLIGCGLWAMSPEADVLALPGLPRYRHNSIFVPVPRHPLPATSPRVRSLSAISGERRTALLSPHRY